MEGFTGYGALIAAILILVKVLRDEQVRHYTKKTNKKNCNPNGFSTLNTKLDSIALAQTTSAAQLKEIREGSIKTNMYLKQIVDDLKDLKP